MHGAAGGWDEARQRRRAAQEGERWHAEEVMRLQARHWNAVMREIERQTSYRHQPDTATWMTDR